MFLDLLRRRVAFLIYPEITLEISQAGGATRRGRRTEENLRLASQIRELDRLYSIYGGRVLNSQNMPPYTGPMYDWRSSAKRVRQDVLVALTALRRDTGRTVHGTTHYACVNYFAAIWPANAPWPSDLEWPRAISRPSKTKKEAA